MGKLPSLDEVVAFVHGSSWWPHSQDANYVNDAMMDVNVQLSPMVSGEGASPLSHPRAPSKTSFRFQNIYLSSEDHQRVPLVLFT
ncbi:hypothetical protein QJS04_geneDACA014668 [Acorus gramineus]|uniref:Uncharacterized protein n=1 Tax=Acorus gramineus TaxID=55184 RepID=A0AAV9B256_ACOGR|nr:hypothetical protein QJS04_geneDACA014668 [Acorus gramineus]